MGERIQSKDPFRQCMLLRTSVSQDSLSISPHPSMHFQHLAAIHKSTVPRVIEEICNGRFGPRVYSSLGWLSNMRHWFFSLNWKICLKAPLKLQEKSLHGQKLTVNPFTFPPSHVLWRQAVTANLATTLSKINHTIQQILKMHQYTIFLLDLVREGHIKQYVHFHSI